MANEMETFAARLATFDLVLQPDRRSSSLKSAKQISWPHSRPSPAELAHAGFFYNPYETNPDNTTCFLCRRALDGWEEDDNPITEHLKHARDCGWAVMMDIQQRSSNPAEIEDPTSETIAQARQSTFGESWPHDGKKGWLCQSDKMVEAGWYFCPNEESADLASCPYCKLSLDGWEPKDNPFDEHYRRSSDCSFFVFAKPAKGKGSRSRKGRNSKASRQSTQSTATEVMASDTEDQVDQSMLSQPAKAKSTKKSSKSKSKASKSKKNDPQETASQMDVDEAEFDQPETSKPKRSTRGRKRSSADLERDTMSIADEDIMVQPEPPAKKRATKRSTSRARSQSIMSTDGATDVAGYESEVTHNEDQTTSRGTKKKASRGHKASSSKTASKSRIPRDSELEAAIEAGLEGEEPQKMETEEVNREKAASKPVSKKSKSKKKNAKGPEPTDDMVGHAADNEAHIEPQPEANQQMINNDEISGEQEHRPAEAKSKRRSSKNTVDQAETTNAREQTEAQEIQEDDHRQHESFISVEIVSKPPAEYPEVETNDKDSKKAKKKASSEKVKKSKKAGKTGKTEEVEKVEEAKEPEEPEGRLENRHSEARETPDEKSPQVSRSHTPDLSKQEHVQHESSRRRSSKVPPKTAERYSDIPQEKQYAKSIASDRSPEHTRYPDKQDREDGSVSPLPSASRETPLSPQSSDAENHPPSMKALTHQPQPSSPSKNASVRFPMATSTPSPSKRNTSAGNLQTAYPWAPINIDEILVASASDKEYAAQGVLSNIKGELTSPEKKMTMEEWIMWNARNGEERLKRECERLVGQFEREGARAMRALEGIECVD
ncbi:hypothetical protein BDW62DRAFT_189569 [Aspergillus aurantiobrunneus]